MTLLQYKGYTGQATIDLDAGTLFGRVQDIRDVITFQGETVAELRQAFEDSIEDYLAWCAERGEEPDKPYSGKLPFRTTPENHRIIAQAARVAGKSINAWMESILVPAAERLLQAPVEAPASYHGAFGFVTDSLIVTRSREPVDACYGQEPVRLSEYRSLVKALTP